MRESWDRFIADNQGSFLQSWEWGEFQKNIGRNVRRFVLHDGEIGIFDDSLSQNSKAVKSKTRQREAVALMTEGKTRQPAGTINPRIYRANPPRSGGVSVAQTTAERILQREPRAEGERAMVKSQNYPSTSSRSRARSGDKSKFKTFVPAKIEPIEPDGMIQFIEMPLPLGLRYWYGTRGPAVDESRITNHESRRRLLAAFGKDVAVTGDAIFLRVDPAWSLEYKDDFIKQGWRETIDVQPRRNWVLNIAPSEEALLEKMHPKTRYNIRLAQKNGVRIRRGDSGKDIARFWQLMQETAARHGIRPHPQQYYQEMLAMPIAELWQAEYEGRVVASQIMIYFGRRATYLHGASSYGSRSLMAPYLLHWKIMQEAKQHGFTEYDFGGIDAAHWPGITRFKQGFGGTEEKFVGTFDFPLRPLRYALYTIGCALMKNR